METVEQPAGSIQDFRENAVHGTPSYPMQAYVNHFRWCPEHQIGWHWHPEIELTVVLSGEVEIFHNNSASRLSAGEGIFINAGAMHRQAAIPGCEEFPVLATICFLPEFVCGNSEDLIYRKYVLPVVGDRSLRCMELSPEIPWQEYILRTVRDICDISGKQEYGFELRCRCLIAELWLKLAENIGESAPEPPDRGTLVREKRLKKMLTYIYENYQDEVSVEDIARAASVSKSECFRCFRAMIGKKPVEFLNEYRLKKSLELLGSTDAPITEVSIACGFGHISYFGRLFREAYGMSPRDYRKNSGRRAES